MPPYDATMTFSPHVRFFGAVGTVTGSRFLLESSEARVLVDAGLFQGPDELRRGNWEAFPVDPASIDAVIVTHAHLDHCGYLPRLVKQGFEGRIFLTPYTAALAAIVLRDSARIQIEDANHAARHGYSSHHPPLPLYDEDDAEAAIARFETVPYHVRTPVATGVTVTFHFGGHILGSSFADVTIDNKRVIFSGDLGRTTHPLLNPPDDFPDGPVDALVVESTYGDREHPHPSHDFAEALRSTLHDGGYVVIPAFAVDRTELILMKIKQLMATGEIPPVPVYVDSPMALAALDVYRQARKERDPEIRFAVLDSPDDPFDTGRTFEARSVEESKGLNNPHEPCILISASGMATGGRVVHHLEHALPNERCTIVLVGYQAVGTRGQYLLEGHRDITIYGNHVPIRARIVLVEEFSSHGDARDVASWIGAESRVRHAYVVHGEPSAAQTLATTLRDQLTIPTSIPEFATPYVL